MVRKDSPHLALLIDAMFLFIVTEFKLLSVVYLFVKSWGEKLQSQLEDKMNYIN